MSETISTLTVFIQPIVLLVALVFLYGIALRSDRSGLTKNVVLGGLFGLATLYAMSHPIEIGDGVIFDIRSLIVGLAAALTGWIAGAVTMTIAVGYRVYLGGMGTLPGIVSIVAAAALGLAWRRFLKNRISNVWLRYGALGMMISFSMVGIFLLPADIARKAFEDLVGLIVVSNVLGAIFVGLLAEREKDMTEAARRSALEAARDPLTALLNRRSASKQVSRLNGPDGAGQGRGIMCFDVDHFKAVNDEYGHLAGDEVLRTITERVQTCLRPGDLFSRLGGDEFVVVLPSISQQDIGQVAERCRLAVTDNPIEHQKQRIPTSISIGVDWQIDPPEFEQQLFNADQSLYVAKRNGRNKVAISYNEQPAELTATEEVA